jgi:hypothetical protein
MLWVRFDDLRAENAHDLCAFGAGQPVDVELAHQVAGFVLKSGAAHGLSLARGGMPSGRFTLTRW